MRTTTKQLSSALTILFLLMGCAQLPDRPSLTDYLTPNLKLTKATFTSNIPEGSGTVFDITSSSSEDPSKPNLVIDSSGGQTLFPLEQAARVFSSHDEVNSFLQQSLGATPVKSENGETIGYQGNYIAHGSSYFWDPDPGIMYRITDPLLAYLGGAYGLIEISGEKSCVDPDGNCDNGYASYLEPVGEVTRLTQRRSCGPAFSNGTAVCVQHHSFWNNYNIFARWVRHGSNIRFTSYSALPESRLIVRSRIVHERRRSPGFETEFLPRIDILGQNSAEAAAFCWGGCPDFLSRALVVCGDTTIVDPDISVTGQTGNGPGNDPTDPGFQCP